MPAETKLLREMGNGSPQGGKGSENRNGVEGAGCPAYNGFWFAGADEIEAENGIFSGKLQTGGTDHLYLLSGPSLWYERCHEQEEITKELKELLKEVG